jgi:hypothetical protein
MEMVVDKPLVSGVEFHQGDRSGRKIDKGFFTKQWQRGLICGYLALELQKDPTAELHEHVWKGEITEEHWGLIRKPKQFAADLTALLKEQCLFPPNQVLSQEAIEALVDPNHPHHSELAEVAPPWYGICTGSMNLESKKWVTNKGFHGMQHLETNICGDSTSTMYKPPKANNGGSKSDYPIRHTMCNAWDNNTKF